MVSCYRRCILLLMFNGCKMWHVRQLPTIKVLKRDIFVCVVMMQTFQMSPKLWWLIVLIISLPTKHCRKLVMAFYLFGQWMCSHPHSFTDAFKNCTRSEAEFADLNWHQLDYMKVSLVSVTEADNEEYSRKGSFLLSRSPVMVHSTMSPIC